jgi:hypothetical protein
MEKASGVVELMNDSAFSNYVRASQQVLTRLETELSQQDRKLWLSAEFGKQAERFLESLSCALEGVVPAPPPGGFPIDVTWPVADWEYLPARRKRATRRWLLIWDLMRTLVGWGRADASFLRTVVWVSRPRTLTVQDPREPGGGPVEVCLDVAAHRVIAPPRDLPEGLDEIPLMWGYSLPVSASWFHRVRQAWNRLRNRAIPDAEYEPVLEETTRTITVLLDAIPLENCTPAQRAYWHFRREIRADAEYITDFVLTWDARLQSQTRATQDLAEEVAALPCFDEAPRQLAECRKSMQQACSEISDCERELRKLQSSLEEAKQQAHEVRPELFGGQGRGSGQPG